MSPQGSDQGTTGCTTSVSVGLGIVHLQGRGTGGGTCTLGWAPPEPTDPPQCSAGTLQPSHCPPILPGTCDKRLGLARGQTTPPVLSPAPRPRHGAHVLVSTTSTLPAIARSVRRAQIGKVVGQLGEPRQGQHVVHSVSTQLPTQPTQGAPVQHLGTQSAPWTTSPAMRWGHHGKGLAKTRLWGAQAWTGLPGTCPARRPSSRCWTARPNMPAAPG